MYRVFNKCHHPNFTREAINIRQTLEVGEGIINECRHQKKNDLDHYAATLCFMYEAMHRVFLLNDSIANDRVAHLLMHGDTLDIIRHHKNYKEAITRVNTYGEYFPRELKMQIIENFEPVFFGDELKDIKINLNNNKEDEKLQVSKELEHGKFSRERIEGRLQKVEKTSRGRLIQGSGVTRSSRRELGKGRIS